MVQEESKVEEKEVVEKDSLKLPGKPAMFGKVGSSLGGALGTLAATQKPADRISPRKSNVTGLAQFS